MALERPDWLHENPASIIDVKRFAFKEIPMATMATAMVIVFEAKLYSC